MAIGDRWLGLSALFLPSVWLNMYRTYMQGHPFSGNLDGEGRLLGGLLVVGPGNTGVVYEYHENVFGDHADPQVVLNVTKRIAMRA
eukprot:JP437469.1.p3 GENE.JP437469.1~~JP437469.1.p3  ORF type:complete len:86 (+),score=2.70 JP437469.1:209-466(+)